MLLKITQEKIIALKRLLKGKTTKREEVYVS
jgi:hypothetical protein